jgi:hypothetical protein
MVWRIEHDIIDRVNRKEITMTLYEITGDIRELQSMLADGEDETIINDTLESVMDDFTDKADAYGAVIRNLEADANAYAEEIKRLTAKKTTAENGIKRLKTALLNAMIETGNEKIEGKVFKISTKNNAPQLPKDITLKSLPEEIQGVYSRIKDPELDKVKLLADVKAGVIKGIELEHNKSLLIK